MEKRGRRKKDEALYKEVAARLKGLFGDRSAEDISNMLDGLVSYRTVYDYLNGIALPGADVLIKISEKFGVTIDWILRGEATPAPKSEKEKFLFSVLREAEAAHVDEDVVSFARWRMDEEKKKR